LQGLRACALVVFAYQRHADAMDNDDFCALARRRVRGRRGVLRRAQNRGLCVPDIDIGHGIWRAMGNI